LTHSTAPARRGRGCAFGLTGRRQRHLALRSGEGCWGLNIVESWESRADASDASVIVGTEGCDGAVDRDWAAVAQA
jgi:hypothetical protein